MEGLVLEAIEVARLAVEIASDKQAGDIVLLDARGVCSYADYFVLCTAETERQTRAVYEEVSQKLKNQGIVPHHYEGTLDSGWLLLDYGDVIMHIFSPAERDYYQFDRLWSDASPVLRIQ